LEIDASLQDPGSRISASKFLLFLVFGHYCCSWSSPRPGPGTKGAKILFGRGRMRSSIGLCQRLASRYRPPHWSCPRASAAPRRRPRGAAVNVGCALRRGVVAAPERRVAHAPCRTKGSGACVFSRKGDVRGVLGGAGGRARPRDCMCSLLPPSRFPAALWRKRMRTQTQDTHAHTHDNGAPQTVRVNLKPTPWTLNPRSKNSKS
jgi:hypothetical protein